jgi:hypothetical protein
MFVHSVYFWLREDLTEAEHQGFIKGVQSLTTLPSVHAAYIGVPAQTDRPVIDRSYSYALAVIFDDRAAHDAYQAHPDHAQFLQDCAAFWKRLVIYDSVG